MSNAELKILVEKQEERLQRVESLLRLTNPARKSKSHLSKVAAKVELHFAKKTKKINQKSC